MMKWFEILKDTGRSFMADKAMRLSAALAYYSIFSLGPLLIVAISMAGTIFGEKAARGAVKAELTGSIGPEAAEAVQEMIKGINASGKSGLMAIVGFGILLISASGVFAQLKDAMNTVWNIRPREGRGLLALVWDRMLSLTMVLVIGFLLLVSLVLSATVDAAVNWLGPLLSVHPMIFMLLNAVISLAVVTLLFAMIFKILPDADVRWRDVWEGAFITSCLFAFGKYLLAIYLSHQSGKSAYGAAGAFILVLSWIYYSANILLLGAEFTQVLARYRGRRIEPTEGGRWNRVKKESRKLGEELHLGHAKCSPAAGDEDGKSAENSIESAISEPIGIAARSMLIGGNMKTTDPESVVNSIEAAATDFEAKAKLESGKAHASQAAHELKDAAVLKAQQVKDSTVQKAVDVRRQVENRVQDARSRCEQRTQEEPAKCLLMAFGAGLVLGLFLRR